MKKTTLLTIFGLVLGAACLGFIQNHQINLDPQVTATITDTTETTLMSADSLRKPVLVTMTISSDTEQTVTIKTGSTTRMIYHISANSPGVIAPPDGVICYGATGEAITATCSSSSHSTTIYARYYGIR